MSLSVFFLGRPLRPSQADASIAPGAPVLGALTAGSLHPITRLAPIRPWSTETWLQASANRVDSGGVSGRDEQFSRHFGLGNTAHLSAESRPEETGSAPWVQLLLIYAQRQGDPANCGSGYALLASLDPPKGTGPHSCVPGHSAQGELAFAPGTPDPRRYRRQQSSNPHRAIKAKGPVAHPVHGLTPIQPIQSWVYRGLCRQSPPAWRQHPVAATRRSLRRWTQP